MKDDANEIARRFDRVREVRSRRKLITGDAVASTEAGAIISHIVADFIDRRLKEQRKSNGGSR